jgi:L-amino acid N-acyltransferase YncA
MSGVSVVMRKAVAADASAICLIYNHYVENTVITFEEAPVTASDMAARIDEISSASLPWLVEERNGLIMGYAYASKWKVRAAYRYSVETTIYLAPSIVRMGIGTSLYKELLRQLKERGTHAVIGGIALPNAASVALHERLGYRKVAEFAEVGFKFEKWVNVGYWELTI